MFGAVAVTPEPTAGRSKRHAPSGAKLLTAAQGASGTVGAIGSLQRTTPLSMVQLVPDLQPKP
ncbi:MAG: hypothetical protein C0423_01820 [Methylibium sp.]|nr:hypothetical protein [Methylibium sp.]